MGTKMAKEPGAARGPFLVAIDLSPNSEAALLWAARTARSFEAPLVALHVVHDPASSPGYYRQVKKRGTHLKRLEETAADMLSEFLAAMRSRHPELLGDLETRLVTGLPITRILEVAKEIGAQMIVVGNRGRTGLKNILLGSKAQKVVQLAPVPVTVVKNPAAVR